MKGRRRNAALDISGVAKTASATTTISFTRDEVERATSPHSGSSTYQRSVTCRINFLMIMIVISAR